MYLQHGSVVHHHDVSDECSIDPVWVAVPSIDCNDATAYDESMTMADRMDRRPNIPVVHGSVVAAGSARCDETAAESMVAESLIATPDDASTMCCRGCCGRHFHYHGSSIMCDRDLDACYRQV